VAKHLLLISVRSCCN